MRRAHIRLDKEAVADFCGRHHIRRLALFGSVLTDEFRPESDIDVLVEFEPGQEPGLLGLARMERELSEILGGRKADIRTPEDLSKYFRDEVSASAEVQYAEE
jgi:hypothetical protein